MISDLQKPGSNAAINFPRDICCNCGTCEGLSSLRTPMHDGIAPELPYCRECEESAARKPSGIMAKLLYSTLLAILISVGGLATLPASVTLHMGENILVYSMALAAGMVFWYSGSRRHTARQTSYYQPVRLKKVRQRFNRKNVRYVFTFTNAEYEAMFADANRPAISDKSVEIART